MDSASELYNRLKLTYILGCQRGFPCNRDPPIYYIFSIKCGGPLTKTSDDIVHERDDEAFGPATYYVPTSNRWAVSNAGLRADTGSPENINTSLSQLTNTVDPKLFKTARTSGGSLRYYGLELENGNYTVKLQFAEIVIPNPPTWISVGKQIFDIYIQETLHIHHGIQGDVADEKGVICNSDVDGVIHRGI